MNAKKSQVDGVCQGWDAEYCQFDQGDLPVSRSSGFHLDFERPIVELEKKIEELDSQSEIDGLDLQQEVERFRARAEKLREEIYSNLNAWQRVQISRHPDRPYALDYVERMLSDFTELHGDRFFGDDGAIIGGPARLDGESLMLIGIQSGDNDRFYRQWQEVSHANMSMSLQSLDDTENKVVWAPLQRGGHARKWYGNNSYVVNLSNSAREIQSVENSSLRNSSEYFQECISWNRLSNGRFYPRYVDKGFAFDDVSPFLTTKEEASIYDLLACLGSSASRFFVRSFSTGYKTEVGHVAPLPLPNRAIGPRDWNKAIGRVVQIARSDWDAYETSWDFTRLPLLVPDYHQPTLKGIYQKLRAHWLEMTLEVQRLEEENNRIFIEAYGLQDELTPEVPLNEITLTVNPHYRYGNDKSENELETLLLADTMRELVSYAVGCMFGRYALDKPGLVLANQGETIEDYLKQVPEPSFPVDEDNVIPMLDGDWFTDDITERFREFLRITFGEEYYEENLRFVEQALGKDIRKYFLKDFYNDHVRHYKKRPIYWLFSSPKGSFNALIYMHRYQPHTVGTVLEYLRDFKDEKLQARKNHLEAVSISAGASPGEKTKALKEIEKINKILAELDDYERDVLYPLATEQVEIDLDNGVKANYPKFGEALKKIPGLS